MNIFGNLVYRCTVIRMEDQMLSNTDIFVSTLKLHKAVPLFVHISNAYVAERLWSSQKARDYFQN